MNERHLTTMYGRAMKENWPIKPEYREVIVNHLMKVILDPSYSERHKQSAIRHLMSADAQNKSVKVYDNIDQSRNRFLDIAERLGIGTSPSRVANGASGGDYSNPDERLLRRAAEANGEGSSETIDVRASSVRTRPEDPTSEGS